MMITFWSITQISSGLMSLLLGINVYHLNPRSRVNKSFFIMSVFIFLWGFSNFQYQNSFNIEEANFWQKFFPFWILVPAPFLLFNMHYTNRFKSQRFLFWATTLILAVMYILNVPTLIFSGVSEKTSWGWITQDNEKYGMWIFAWAVLLIAVTVYVSYGFVKRFLSSDRNSKERKKTGIIALAFLVPIVFSVPSMIFYYLNIPDFSLILNVVQTILVAYAIAKYKVLKINPVTASEKVMTTMTDLVILVDDSMRIVSINPKVAETLGFKKSELMGQKIFRICEAGKKDVIKFFREIEKKIVDRRLDFLSSEGRTIPMSVSGAVINDSKKVVAGYILIGRDMRSRIQNEEKERRLVAKIEKLNMEFIERENRMIDLKKEIDKLEHSEQVNVD